MMPHDGLMIDAQKVRELCAKSAADERSVRRAYAGKPTRAGTWHRVDRAARDLGIDPPPGQVRRITPGESDR